MTTNDKDLPPLPWHPEPHTMTWSKLEEKAILAYAGRAVAEALAWRDGWKLVAEQEAFEAWVLEWRKSTWRPLPSDTRQDMPTHWNVNAVHHMRIAWEARAALSFGATQDSLPRAEKVGDAQPSPVVAPPTSEE